MVVVFIFLLVLSVKSEEYYSDKYGAQIDLPFTGPLSFAHLPYLRCLNSPTTPFDVALLGLPFDTATTYRPGARFGPYAIRSAARRMRPDRAFSLSWHADPYSQGATVIDCGDVPASPFDNALALKQIQDAYATLLSRPVANASLPAAHTLAALAHDNNPHPRIIALGGDHTIVLPALRALHAIYGPIAVIHFDAHLDTWQAYPGTNTPQSLITHGTFFHVAWEEGLLAPHRCIHAGIRCKLAGDVDVAHDSEVGFTIISTDDIDDLGIPEIADRILARVGGVDVPVYLSVDIDVIDPGHAPGTGTPESGGWTPRELKRLFRALAARGLFIVGADIVEVAPAYDRAEVTAIVAADIVHDFLGVMLVGDPSGGKSGGGESDNGKEREAGPHRDEL